MLYGNSNYSTSRLDSTLDGLQDVQGALMLLNALQNSENVSYPEERRDQWLSGHLDRSFVKRADESSLPSIMEVARSKGPDYTSRMYENSCARCSLAEHLF
jgi:hypothetical protein